MPYTVFLSSSTRCAISLRAAAASPAHPAALRRASSGWRLAHSRSTCRCGPLVSCFCRCRCFCRSCSWLLLLLLVLVAACCRHPPPPPCHPLSSHMHICSSHMHTCASFLLPLWHRSHVHTFFPLLPHPHKPLHTPTHPPVQMHLNHPASPSPELCYALQEPLVQNVLLAAMKLSELTFAAAASSAAFCSSAAVCASAACWY